MNGLAEESGAFFTSVIAKAHANCENFAVTQFGSTAATHTLDLTSSVSANYEYLMRNKKAGGGTNFQVALMEERNLGFKPDVVFVITDNEINAFGSTNFYGMGSSDSAVKAAAPGAVKFVINAATSESTPMPERFGWHALAGLSAKLFDYAEALKNGSSIVKQLSVAYPYKG
jgi:hypothetical protein